MRIARTILLIAMVCVIIFFATSGRFLVIDRPERGDVIVVLAGETERRPERGLELLTQGVAPRMLLDVPAQTKIYRWSQLELAEDYLRQLPQTSSLRVCPIYGLSTEGEAGDVGRCLKDAHITRVLLVTSDYHTRRALSTFERRLPQFHYSVAAANSPTDFEVDWWKRRQWAKVNFDEWLRLVWWEAVDRWR